MTTPTRLVQPPRYGSEGLRAGSGVSPITALIDAFSDTVQLLLDPFDAVRWLKISALCLFLGGGTASAALHWVLTTMPGEIGLQEALSQLKAHLASLPGFLYVSSFVAVSFVVAMIYVRATCRFALIETILVGEPRLRRGWQNRRRLARSYFLWLLAILALMAVMLGAGLLFALPRLRGEAGPGDRSLFDSIMLVGLLLGEVSVGLVAGVLITLTDDFAVPIMLAENHSLLAAWRKLATILRSEVPAFTVYFMVRLVVSVAIGVAALFLLFPALVALFSVAIIMGAGVVLTLQLAGLDWAWTPVTVAATALALSVLVGLLLVLLGVAGMPGQVLLQTFGMRFLSSRLASLNALWPPPSPSEETP